MIFGILGVSTIQGAAVVWTDDDFLLGVALLWGPWVGGARCAAWACAGELPARWAEGPAAWPGLTRGQRERLEALRCQQPERVGASARRPWGRWVGWGEPGYPEAWREQGPGAPAAVQVRGAWPPPERAIAVVGTRKPTDHGLAVAEALGRGLSELGWAVVSGLALGVDGAAHRGAVAAGRPTWALVGGGLDRVHPASHRGLAEELVALGGALVSAWPPDQEPRPWHFLARNELMAALTLGTVVVEAPLHSGSIHTANAAGRLGREVMAVPGAALWPSAAGGHALLRDGASLVCSAEEVVAALGPGGLKAQASVAEASPALRQWRASGGGGGQPKLRQRPAQGGPPPSGGRPSLLARLQEGEGGLAVALLEAVSRDDGALDRLLALGLGSTPEVLTALGLLELKGKLRRQLFGYVLGGP